MTATPTRDVTRRGVMCAAAWSVPTIVSCSVAPAFAASSAVGPSVTAAEVRLCGGRGEGSRRTYEVDLSVSARPETLTVTTVVTAKETYKVTETERITDTACRISLTTPQPLAANGAMTVSYLSNGFFQTSTVSYTTSGDRCTQ